MLASMVSPKIRPLSRSLRSFLTCSAVLGLALSGCAADDSTASEVGETGSEGEGSESGSSGDGSAEGMDEGSQTELPLDPGTPAMGIAMTQVEANQGTAIFIGEDGEWIAGDDRLGALVKDRNLLIRVHYRVDPGWVDREIEARFIIQFADGSRETLSQTRMVDGDSQPNSLGTTFIFGLEAEAGLVVPGMEYVVQLHEVDEGVAASAAGLEVGRWQTPPEFEAVGIQPEPMELKIVFVPYHHQFQNIDRIADTSDATMKLIVDTLFQQNAVTEVNWEVHAPLVWAQPMENLGSVLGPIAALRDNELAFPNVYYHALFPVPNGGVAGVAGIASVPGPGKGEGMSRVSATALGQGVNFAAGVVLHEVGHNQGMAHVFCPFAEAAGPDPSYPYTNGVIGQWGFGLLDLQLYAPDSYRDYMSYCDPSWVSTWSWRKSFERTRVLTSWDYEGESSDPEVVFAQDRPLLVASIPNGAEEFWWIAHGTLPSGADPYGAEYDHQIELRAGGELEAALPTVVRYSNDYSTAWVISELPEAYEELSGIDEILRIDDDDQVWSVPASVVQRSTRTRVQLP